MLLALCINDAMICCRIFCHSFLKHSTSVIFIVEVLSPQDTQQGLLGVQIYFH